MKQRRYALCADVHMHNWMTFGSVVPDSGISSRLEGLLEELARVAHELGSTGATIVIAGDLFHVRGSVSPSVLNPVRDMLSQLTQRGFQFVVLAGNHDLEKRDASRISSAVTALEGPGVVVVNEPMTLVIEGKPVLLVPWVEEIGKLKQELQLLAAGYDDIERARMDLILHAPIDGVIHGLPDHGLTAEWLQALGFGQVFSGHYHNHKQFAGTNVVSIGALSHHTWSDAGSSAGFVLVDAKGPNFEFRASNLPEFKDVDHMLSLGMEPEDIMLAVDGHYVRVTIEAEKDSDIEKTRRQLTEAGAKGVVVRVAVKAKNERAAGVATQSGPIPSIAQASVDWTKRKVADPAIAALVAAKVVDIIHRAEQVAS
jgi:DNA repair exonuclease SbcCD nuclease subunit